MYEILKTREQNTIRYIRWIQILQRNNSMRIIAIDENVGPLQSDQEMKCFFFGRRRIDDETRPEMEAFYIKKQ